MIVKKRISAASTCYDSVVPIQHFARQLESLYARRSAVETLIQSLEDYDSVRPKRPEPQELKTA